MLKYHLDTECNVFGFCDAVVCFVDVELCLFGSDMCLQVVLNHRLWSIKTEMEQKCPSEWRNKDVNKLGKICCGRKEGHGMELRGMSCYDDRLCLVADVTHKSGISVKTIGEKTLLGGNGCSHIALQCQNEIIIGLGKRKQLLKFLRQEFSAACSELYTFCSRVFWIVHIL